MKVMMESRKELERKSRLWSSIHRWQTASSNCSSLFAESCLPDLSRVSQLSMPWLLFSHTSKATGVVYSPYSIDWEAQRGGRV